MVIGKSQNKLFVLENICPTETATAIHAQFLLPFEISVNVEEKKLSGNYRPSYIYHLTPKINNLKNNEIKLFIGGFSNDSDSTLSNSLLLDGFKKVKNYEYLFYNKEDLTTFKSGVFLGVKYNFQLTVKHNQDEDNFDIGKLEWFVDMVKSWKLIHGNRH